MSVYIPGMEMPTSCEDCPMAFAVNFGTLCTPTKRIVGDGEISKKQGFCPLVPVPEHGRLKDADALRAWFVEWYDPKAELEINHFLEILDGEDSALTIIPADKETEK